MRAWLDDLISQSTHHYVSPFTVAEVYAHLGENDHSLEWLEKAYQEHDSGLVSIAVEPMFGPMRTNPRFVDIVRRMKLSAG